MSTNNSSEQIQKDVKRLIDIVEKQGERISKLERVDNKIETFGQPVPDLRVKKTTKEKSTKKKDFELKVGVHYLSRIGMIGVLLGISYFLKYSFDNNWIGPLGRIVIGAIGGLLLIVVGEYFRKKYELWSRVFTGGGLAVLYFTSFAANHFYAFLTIVGTAYVMGAITFLAGIIAIWYNSHLVAALGLVGGFLTPLLISDGIEKIPFLILWFILILNLGVLVISCIKRWHFLHKLAFLLTVLYTLNLFNLVPLPVALLCLSAYFVIFSAGLLIQIYRPSSIVWDGLKVEYNSLFVLALPTYFYWHFHSLLNLEYSTMVGITAFTLAGIYAIYFFVLRNKKSFNWFVYTSITVAMAFVATGIAVLLDFEWVTILWALFALGVVYSGIKTKDYNIRILGFLLFVLTLIHFFILIVDSVKPDILVTNPLLNTEFISGFVVVICVSAAWYLYKQNRDLLTKDETHALTRFYSVISHSVFVVIIVNELYLYVFPNQLNQTLISIFLGLYAAVLVTWGVVADYIETRILGLVLFAITVIKVIIYDLSELDTIYRVLAFVVLGLILIFTSYMYQRKAKLNP